MREVLLQVWTHGSGLDQRGPGFPGVSGEWQETPKRLAEVMGQVLWQGLAGSSRVVSSDLSREKPLGQEDSHGMTWKEPSWMCKGPERERVECGSHPEGGRGLRVSIWGQVEATASQAKLKSSDCILPARKPLWGLCGEWQ